MNTSNAVVEDNRNDFCFIARSTGMRQLRAHAELLGRVDVPVLIVGESGSGKEWTANLIHYSSSRSNHELLKINCAALPPGSARNDTTFLAIALKAQAPIVKDYEKGAILLDEVTDIPYHLQAKLLTMIRDNQQQTGGRVSARIFATTSISLERALVEGRLREDLYYRLSAFTIHIPPLRERADDIESLLQHFMVRLAQHHQLTPRSFSHALLHGCQRYSWPGNLRELEAFVERYLVLGDEALALRDLCKCLPLNSSVPREAKHLDSIVPLPEDGYSLKRLVRDAKQQAETSAISIALDTTGWNRKEAARLLGISYRGLLYKIEHYHIRDSAHLSNRASGRAAQ